MLRLFIAIWLGFGFVGCASLDGQAIMSKPAGVTTITSESLMTQLKSGVSVEDFKMILGEPGAVFQGFGNENYYLYSYQFKDKTTRILSVLVDSNDEVIKYMFFKPEWLDAL